MKAKLQDAMKYKVMSFQEAAKALGWTVDEDSDSFSCICGCGDSKIEYSGFFGIEVVECQSCGKRVVNCFFFFFTKPGCGAMLDFRQFEVEKDENGYDKFWIADDGKGGIKNE